MCLLKFCKDEKKSINFYHSYYLEQRYIAILRISVRISFSVFLKGSKYLNVRHVTGNDQDYLRKIPRAVVQISALL
jgi:hypothetical protein